MWGDRLGIRLLSLCGEGLDDVLDDGRLRQLLWPCPPAPLLDIGNGLFELGLGVPPKCQRQLMITVDLVQHKPIWGP